MNYSENPEVLEAMVEAYVLDCAENKAPVSIPGCVLYLGLESTAELYAVGAVEGCERAIARLKTHCEAYAISRLYSTTPTGGIFALKQLGWSDSVQKHTADVRITIEGKDAQL